MLVVPYSASKGFHLTCAGRVSKTRRLDPISLNLNRNFSKIGIYAVPTWYVRRRFDLLFSLGHVYTMLIAVICREKGAQSPNQSQFFSGNDFMLTLDTAKMMAC